MHPDARADKYITFGERYARSEIVSTMCLSDFGYEENSTVF